MNRVLLMQKVSGTGPFVLTAEEQQHLSTALEAKELMDSWAPSITAFLSNPAVGAFNWTALLSFLTPILGLIPGLGPILALLPNINQLITLINQILAIFKVNPIPPLPPLPVPTPVPPVPGGGGFLPVNPVDWGTP